MSRRPEDTDRGHIDSTTDGIIKGWAVGRASADKPPSLLLLVDGAPVASFTCDEPRPDLNALGFKGDKLGFTVELPRQFQDGKLYPVEIRTSAGTRLTQVLPDGSQISEIPISYQRTTVTGVIDGMTGTTIRGWVFRTDHRTGENSGNVTLDVLANGVRLGSVNANLIRSDVAAACNCAPQCGFSFPLPPRMRDGKRFSLAFLAVPERTPLQGSPFSGTAPTRDSIDQLYGLYGKLEDLATQVYGLKDQLRQMLTFDEFTILSYQPWAYAYFETLRSRVQALRGTTEYEALMVQRTPRQDHGPKVSVICPVYKPLVADFVAAVESVRSQTWQNWELIIVDDGSGQTPLTETIDRLAKSDGRIRAIPHTRNQGISAATNTAIAAATGDWIVLFDHDDLLVDVALEVMLVAAANTGAKLLYSDEDKVDNLGVLSEPHLKTDWNYRLLLAVNYVCHLLMIDAATVRAAGPFNPAFDGAQDHDFVLRMAERLDAADIHHVPEILYHWRKTAVSTAATGAAKSYAVEAGRQALLAHFARLKLTATVTAPFDSTLYDIRYEFNNEPKVTILIPFKDQLATTRHCVECILNNTGYENYEIMLIDNWSTETQTEAWLSKIAATPKVRVVRIEEPFNFSRINNLAAARSDASLLLFMNNDVFVGQVDWLTRMVSEAQADPRVGAVGIKLIYPNQTVQHGGVVLGVGGVADHAFKYFPRDDRGYINRAICAADMSAVTAACMLCRADAFRAVGMFDETSLAVAFNDVDLCLKIGRAGYRIVYAPAVVAEHHESLSRGNDLAEHHLPRFYGENQAMWDRWGELLRNDPFYNPHFSHETGVYEKLSSASLDIARAPSLLRKPIPRAKLTVAPPLEIGHVRRVRTPRAGENGTMPVAEGATGPRKRSGKEDRGGARTSGKPATRRPARAAAPTE